MEIKAKVSIDDCDLHIELPDGTVVKRTFASAIEKFVCMFDRYCVVLSGNDDEDTSKNLLCISYSGELLWVSDAPSVEDSWSNVWVEGDVLKAFSWGCFNCDIDFESGKIRNCVFTK